MLDDARVLLDRHAVTHTGPASRFFEGALLGNGGLGVVVTTRPDAVVMHLGHNEVWDERVDESHAEHVLDFKTVLERVTAAAADGSRPTDDPWVRDYVDRMEAPYHSPWPRPWPLGSLVLGIDRRRTRVLRHRLDLGSGEVRIDLLHDGELMHITVFVDQEADHVHIRSHHGDGRPATTPVDRVKLVPDPDGVEAAEAASVASAAVQATVAGEPVLSDRVRPFVDGDQFGYTEEIPAVTAERGHRTRLVVSATGGYGPARARSGWHGDAEEPPVLERSVAGHPLELVLTVGHERAGSPAIQSVPASPEEARRRSIDSWRRHWERSTVAIDVPELEAAWYRSTYHRHCCLRSGRTAPGIFGNWSLGSIGTAWHGDYHMNYNTQQLFWGVFSGNRIEEHEPYLDLVEHLLPLATDWAANYYGQGGAFFPHSAYPVPMTTMPYASPVWGWEVSETPWTVQSLWWHWLYTREPEVLERIAPAFTQATRFLVEYLERDDAVRPDGSTRIWPTVVPELFGLSAGLRLNEDSLIDIVLTRFVFEAFVEAAPGWDETALAGRVRQLLPSLPELPVGDGPDGPVFLVAPGAPFDVVQNVPIAGSSVFPGERHHLGSSPDALALARRTVAGQRTEGGNDLVFAALQKVRLGILDLEAFVAELTYCELPNGTYADMVGEVHGRYDDTLSFDFMAGMGVWVENFAVTAVVDELLLQSVGGVVRLFPGLPPHIDAAFSTLRTQGAHLVSSTRKGGLVDHISVLSERGVTVRIASPWPAAVAISDRRDTRVLHGQVVELETEAGERITLTEHREHPSG